MLLILIPIIFLLEGAMPDTSPIGTSFYVPKVGLLDDDLVGGYPVFKDLPPQCILSLPDVDIIQGDSSFYENTKSFYHSIASDTSISLKLEVDFTMGFTLGFITNSISGSSNKVRGSTYSAYSQSSKASMDHKCLHNQALDVSLVEAFEKLPTTIEKPWLKSEWTPYQLFLDTYNSHIVTDVKYGSGIYQHCFSDASNSYTAKQYGIKACLDFAGSIPRGSIGLDICSGVTKEDNSSVSSLSISSRLVLRGGTLATRSALYVNHSLELTKKFFEEANSTHSPIQYKFMPIWELLQSKYYNTEHYAKAINLQAYYEGYLNFGCDYLVSATNVELQKFNHSETSTDAYPQYECIIAPYGCQVKEDCHYRDAFWCECRGDSCVSYKTFQSSTNIGRKVPTIFEGSGNAWQGCNLYGVDCECTRNTIWEMIWSSEENGSYLLRSKINW
ncbi:MAC/Perforin domain-containing protein [Oopsacas minuta]|uniref:MAC/Perforin domain-containing protein n=1 Tax=Oopsacas minuta TaxID=111878 RepID=A0AAV7KRL9_9METZ|nr:MAC/Perforin domain-containing protein [Oopsacas minuta]